MPIIYGKGIFIPIYNTFPKEPTSYIYIEDITSSIEFSAPEDGWFQIDAVSGSGSGGRGGYSSSRGRSYSGGAGGSGAISRKSGIKLKEGEIISIVIDYDGMVQIDRLGITCTPGKNGTDAIISHGGTGGTASGGDININGVSGRNGSNNTKQTIKETEGSITENTFGLEVKSGYGGGVKNKVGKDGGEGNRAMVRIYRGNTNVIQ